MCKVSVIIPVYNVEKYLNECLDSVINQTLKDIEIICVDDGSTDSSGKILDEYAQKGIVVIHKPNSGYGHTMNTGLNAAKGEYIGIVESDDYIDSNMYKFLYDKAQKYNADIVKSDFYRFTGNSKTVKFEYNQLDKTGKYYNKVINMQEDTTPFNFLMNTWSGIYKREFLNKNNIRHNETPGASFQDNGFWFQTFALAGNVYFINQPFYYNRRDNLNSSVKSKEKVYCMQKEYDFIRNFLNSHPFQQFKLSNIYYYYKYLNYMFTYNRIDAMYKKEFLEVFSSEFKQAINSENFNASAWNNDDINVLKFIVNNPEKFYYKTEIEPFEKLARQLNSNSSRKIVFWGASLFLEEFLKKYNIKNRNILGVIDKNPDKCGKFLCGYKIFSPEDIETLNVGNVIFSIKNNAAGIYPEVKKYLDFKNINMEPLIFEDKTERHYIY